MLHKEFTLFRELGDSEREVPGIDFGGKILQVYSHPGSPYKVWKKCAGSCWSGIGMSRNYIPVKFWVVETAFDAERARRMKQVTKDDNIFRVLYEKIGRCRDFVKLIKIAKIQNGL